MPNVYYNQWGVQIRGGFAVDFFRQFMRLLAGSFVGTIPLDFHQPIDCEPRHDDRSTGRLKIAPLFAFWLNHGGSKFECCTVLIWVIPSDIFFEWVQPPIDTKRTRNLPCRSDPCQDILGQMQTEPVKFLKKAPHVLCNCRFAKDHQGA